MRRLALEYEIKKMAVLYEETTISWDNAEFTASREFTATLRLWKDSIEPEQVWEELKSLEDRAESFRIALRYRGNHDVTFERKDYPQYYFADRIYPLRSEAEFTIFTEYIRGRRESFNVFHIELPRIIGHMTGHSSPVPLPRNMPLIPFDLHGLAETIIAADELNKYPDLVMKLAFIILEDLKGLNALDVEEVKMKYVRNFVSHPACHDGGVISFVKIELPSAMVTEGVQFRRTDTEHIAFVAKYAYPALQRAKELLEEKVRIEGGFLGD